MVELEAGNLAERNGWAYTATLLGDPIGCGGILLREAGVGEVWSMMSPIARQFPVSFLRISKQVIAKIVKEHGINTLVALVDDDPVKVRFIERLGFPREHRQWAYWRTF